MRFSTPSRCFISRLDLLIVTWRVPGNRCSRHAELSFIQRQEYEDTGNRAQVTGAGQVPKTGSAVDGQGTVIKAFRAVAP